MILGGACNAVIAMLTADGSAYNGFFDGSHIITPSKKSPVSAPF